MAGESARAQARKAREKARRLDAVADRWERGAEGESQTAAALATLGPGWVIWHDVAWPGRRYANIDHVVVGPTGIFVVDSKNWSGSISIRDGVLRQNGYGREREVAGCAEAAIAIGGLVPEHVAACRPVMCFVHPQALSQQIRDVTVCSTSNLVSTIAGGPTIFDANQVSLVADSLRAQITSRTAQSRPAARKTARRASTRGRSKQRRRQRSIAGTLARGAFAIVMLVIVLGAFSSALQELAAR
jgi:hypothetical protein